MPKMDIAESKSKTLEKGLPQDKDAPKKVVSNQACRSRNNFNPSYKKKVKALSPSVKPSLSQQALVETGKNRKLLSDVQNFRKLAVGRRVETISSKWPGTIQEMDYKDSKSARAKVLFDPYENSLSLTPIKRPPNLLWVDASTLVVLE